MKSKRFSVVVMAPNLNLTGVHSSIFLHWTQPSFTAGLLQWPLQISRRSTPPSGQTAFSKGLYRWAISFLSIFSTSFTLTKSDADQFEALFGGNSNVVAWLSRLAKCPNFDPFSSSASEDDDFELFGDDEGEAPKPKAAEKPQKKADDDDDFDLFGEQTEVCLTCLFIDCHSALCRGIFSI